MTALSGASSSTPRHRQALQSRRAATAPTRSSKHPPLQARFRVFISDTSVGYPSHSSMLDAFASQRVGEHDRQRHISSSLATHHTLDASMHPSATPLRRSFFTCRLAALHQSSCSLKDSRLPLTTVIFFLGCCSFSVAIGCSTRHLSQRQAHSQRLWLHRLRSSRHVLRGLHRLSQAHVSRRWIPQIHLLQGPHSFASPRCVPRGHCKNPSISFASLASSFASIVSNQKLAFSPADAILADPTPISCSYPHVLFDDDPDDFYDDAPATFMWLIQATTTETPQRRLQPARADKSASSSLSSSSSPSLSSPSSLLSSSSLPSSSSS